MENSDSNDASHVFHFFLNREYISIANAKGIYLYDDKGNRYIDASGGPILCSLGHGLDEMAEVLGTQAKKLSYAHLVDFTNPPLEKAAKKVCKASDYAMDKVFFVSGMSLCGMVPAKGHFERIREICNKYDVLLMFDEVMTGMGLMRGIEFVEDKKTRKTLDPKYAFSARVAAECMKHGMFIEYSGGCDRGQSGNMIMFGPPFIINETQIDEAVEILSQALNKDLLSDSSNFLTF